MKKVHCIGIGGIGTSSLARYYLSSGWSVSGSDLIGSEITDDLKRDGVKIFIGHDGKNLDPEAEKVVYSVAVGRKNPEIKKSEKLNIQTLTYAEALAEITRDYFTIAVSGSHGKGSTTALLSLIMIEAGLDPTVIIGTRLKEFGGTNFRSGKSKYLVIEADEYDRSFLNYSPQIVIVTNVDNDHLDVFCDIYGVVDVFNQYLKKLREDSTAVLNKNDKHTDEIIKDCKCKIVYFDDPESQWPLYIPGNFSQLNAEAAWRAAEIVGVDKKTAEQAARKYRGSWRRMEELEPINNYKKAIFFADYGHHPTEIRVTTKAFKDKFKDRKLLLLFQPHQVKRLEALFDEFTTCFENVDELALLPVYEVAGREGEIKKTSEDLAKSIIENNKKRNINQQVHYLQTFRDALKLIQEQVVVFMGAGDIDREVRKYFRSKLF
jgi:UDP-N-acetylmuramate--alanine ligase